MARPGTQNADIVSWTKADIKAAIYSTKTWYAAHNLYIRQGRLINNNVPVVQAVKLAEVTEPLGVKYGLQETFKLLTNMDALTTIVGHLSDNGHTVFLGYCFKDNTIGSTTPYRIAGPATWLVNTKDWTQ